jgi:CRP-like cAMP-binding protein
MKSLHLPAGATIFRTGDPSQGVFIIEDGEVAITVRDGIEVARLHPGELFGESGVLEARPRSATATAVIATTLLMMPTETFLHAFGMDNDRALALVKMLCCRLRTTNLRASQSVHADATVAAIRLLPDSEPLTTKYGMEPIDVQHLPFQVGNRYGGETLPLASNHTCCIPARGESNLAAPHFEILRRDGRVGIRDLGTTSGTIVNGTAITRASLNAIALLHIGVNAVIAGRPDSLFRFRLVLH